VQWNVQYLQFAVHSKAKCVKYVGVRLAVCLQVVERYNVYGGKARLIFDYAEVDESFSLRDRAVAVMRWETIEGASRYISTTDDVSRILFTLRVPEWESGASLPRLCHCVLYYNCTFRPFIYAE
jgi:hypothetical protein